MVIKKYLNCKKRLLQHNESFNEKSQIEPSIDFLTFTNNLQAFGQELDSKVDKITPILHALNNFSQNYPQEKVYLHFDNFIQQEHILLELK